MSDLPDAGTILSALTDVREGDFRRLHERLPSYLRSTEPAEGSFTIGPVAADGGEADGGEADLGRYIMVTATRNDGRLVQWLVEAWMYSDGPDRWYINVKAEIDLDDQDGDDRCVLNDQQIVTDAASAVVAIRRATDLVVAYPREHLLADGWEPSDWVEEDL